LSAALAACASSTPAATTGHALSAIGPQASGILGFSNGVVGQTYRWAFPLLSNTGTSPVTVTSFAMDKVPAIFQVIGYPLYSQPEVGDYIVDFADSDHPGMPDLLHKPNHANEPITTAPGQQSPMYAMVAAKLLTNRTDPLTGCLVTYRLGTRTYRQRFDCQFQIGGDRPTQQDTGSASTVYFYISAGQGKS
jgi:hypothetical protein